MKIRAVRVCPGALPELVEIEDTLSALQAEVGGWIEALGLGGGIDAMVNEEGLLKNLPFNRYFATPYGPRPVVGTAILVSSDSEGNTIGLDDKQVDRIMKIVV
jgi:hypothetical protein